MWNDFRGYYTEKHSRHNATRHAITGRGGSRHVQNVRRNRGPHRQPNGSELRACRTAARHCPVTPQSMPLYGVSQHSKGHSVQRRISLSLSLRVEKVFLRAANSSKTASSCSAQFLVDYWHGGTFMRRPHILTNVDIRPRLQAETSAVQAKHVSQCRHLKRASAAQPWPQFDLVNWQLAPDWLLRPWFWFCRFPHHSLPRRRSPNRTDRQTDRRTDGRAGKTCNAAH